jgi:hypothetical protein
MLDRAFQAIAPSNVEHQLLDVFNKVFPKALDNCLNHEVFGENVDYSFTGHQGQTLKMTIIHKLYSFGVDPEHGYKVVYAT